MHLETMNNEEETGGGGERGEKEGSTDANSAKKNYLRSNFPKGLGLSDLTPHLSKRKFLGF